MHKVYIKTDDAGRVLAINSDAFLPSTEGWVQIDEGHGDRYHHAQGNYLPRPLTDERGVCRYQLADGVLTERSTEDMDAEYTPPQAKPSAEERITALEEENAHLKETLEILLSGATEEETADG